MVRPLRAGAGALVLALAIMALPACSTEAKKDVAKSATKSMSEETRRDSFEATARLLDEEPQLVDELYSVVRTHPATMERFLANASRDLENPEFASMTAGLLVQHPRSLEQTLIASIDAIAKGSPARAAMTRAMSKRARLAVAILMDDPRTLARVLAAAMETAKAKPQAREALLDAVGQQRAAIVSFVTDDPKLARAMTKEWLQEAVKRRPALEKALRAAGALDDDAASKSKRRP